jgi:hypothetical protein
VANRTEPTLAATTDTRVASGASQENVEWIMSQSEPMTAVH